MQAHHFSPLENQSAGDVLHAKIYRAATFIIISLVTISGSEGRVADRAPERECGTEFQMHIIKRGGYKTVFPFFVLQLSVCIERNIPIVGISAIR